MTKPGILMRQPTWADELDFVGPRVRTAPWAWALLLGGLLAAAAVWPQVTKFDADMEQAQQEIKRLQRAVHQQKMAAMAQSERSGHGAQVRQLTPDAARHAAQLAQWLAYPWLGVLERLEASARAEQAIMLSFSLDLSTLAAQAHVDPDVHATAAVKDDESALRWAHTLGQSAQLLNRERLDAPVVAAIGRYEWRAQAVWLGAKP